MEELTEQEHIEQIYNILDERGKVLERQGKILESNQQNIEMLIMTLKGNPEYDTEGYKDRISRNEGDITKLDTRVGEAETRFENIYQKIIGICIGVSIAGSVLGYLLSNKLVTKPKAPQAQVERKKSVYTPSLSEGIKPEDITQKIAREYERQD